MVEMMIIFAMILIVCIVTSKALYKFGVPILCNFEITEIDIIILTQLVGKCDKIDIME